MSWGTDKFVINKNINNEFVLTIKQTGTTLPMEIYKGYLTDEVSTTPVVNYTDPVVDTPYIEPLADTHAVRVIGTLIDAVGYRLKITTNQSAREYTISYSAATHTNVQGYLEAVAEAIATYQTELTANVENEVLVVEGPADGSSSIAIDILSNDMLATDKVRIAGQEEVIEVVGQSEKYLVSPGNLAETNTGTEETPVWVGTDYSVWLDDVVSTVTYTEAAHPDTYSYLVDMKAQIVANTPLTVDNVEIAENKMYITFADELEHTVNSSDEIYITQSQNAIESVAGQLYIAEVLYPNNQEEQLYVEGADGYYTATNEELTVEITTEYSGVSNIQVKPNVAVAEVNIEAGAITAVEGWYDIGTATTFYVTPVTNAEELSDPLDAIEIDVQVTLTNAADIFEAQLIKLSDDSVALTKSLTVDDAQSGKIKLSITDAEAKTLESSKGDAVDRYYLKPTYRLMIDCNTVNNGAFIAKVPEVYVE